MEFIVLSDSHGNIRGIKEVLLRQKKDPDGIFFLGDGIRDFDRLEIGSVPLYAVSGNCDSFAEPTAPREGFISLGGHLIFYTHGNGYDVKSGTGAILKRAVELDAEIVLFGHTHSPFCETVPAGETVGEKRTAHPILLFNPGSIGYGSGSFGTLLLQGKTVLAAHGQF